MNLREKSMMKYQPKTSVKLALAFVGLALSGCQAMGLDYFRPKQALPETYQEAAQAASNQEAISSQWWTLYQDAVLNDLIESASKNNTDIKIAVARVEEADAYLREVGAALFPQVNVESNASRYRVTETGAIPLVGGVSPNRSNYNVKLSAGYEIDFWGKLRRAQESAKAQALGSRFAKDTVDLSLKSLVAGDYLLLRSLDAQIALSESSIKTREDSLALTQRRLEGGIASALDVHQAEVAYSNLKAQIAELTRQRAIIEHQLALLTGRLDLTIAKGDIATLPMPPIPPVGLPSSLLEARPDVRQAEQNLIGANARIGVAKAALFPTISLTAGLGGESKDLGDVLKSASRIWSGGVGLSVPIFDSGRLKSKVDQATAEQKQTLATYERAVQQAFVDVNDALVSLRQSAEMESSLDVSQQSARKALEVANNRYKAGYTSDLEVLDAQRVANDTSLAFVQSRQARLKASVDLFKALGGGWKQQEVVQ
jgi:multidrug efflux system outer membrane protein